MRAGVVQLNATAEKARNLEAAEHLVRGAAAAGAELVVLPEKWTVLGDAQTLRDGAEPLDGPTLTTVRSWAADLGIDLIAGSFSERAGDERLFNTSVLIDRDGEIVATYRKIHMFDVEVGGVAYRESDVETGGDRVVVGQAAGVQVGLSVCYDLRFPELYRILALQGALVIAVPSAFTLATGRDHWDVLLRARAIENQAFVLAPNQWGDAPPHYSSYGRSAIVDPWGVVLARVADGEGFATAELDLEALERIRRRLPSLASRRPDAYRWPDVAPQAGPVASPAGAGA
jgi:deaminated glutathione amidase